jgi:methylenetetrahydrofolate reductase (NADPH)
MNHGMYLDQLIDAQNTDFCIGVAAYPEKHFEAPSMGFDVEVLRRKQDAGAHYAATQMFFDNQRYYDYLNRAREAGVHIPIIPGLKIITNKKHLLSLPKAFFISLPEELVDRLLHAKTDKEALEVGINWAYQQSVDLLEKGHLHIHYYIMQNTGPFLALLDKLKKHF